MSDARQESQRWGMLFGAFLVAFLSSLAVLYVGEILGQTPCNLCWFQRAFMFPLAIILGIGAFLADARVSLYAVPLAVLGGSVAAFHNLLYYGVIPEAIQPCGAGPSCSGSDMTVLAGLPLPALSLLAFTLILICLSFVRRRPAS